MSCSGMLGPMRLVALKACVGQVAVGLRTSDRSSPTAPSERWKAIIDRRTALRSLPFSAESRDWAHHCLNNPTGSDADVPAASTAATKICGRRRGCFMVGG